MDTFSIRNFFKDVPDKISIGSILDNYQSIKDQYPIENRKLPLPVWARRGLRENGQDAWRTVQNDSLHYQNDHGYCIYMHIPFCKEKCVFCDCYSFRLANHQETIKEKYLNSLETEMASWNRLGIFQDKRLSTVHLGGGTPTFLGPKYFRRLVDTIRKYFPQMTNTEWALESTSSELDEPMLSLMDKLGFTRLHVGVQSLEDPVRHAISRREMRKAVLEKIEKAIAIGWVVSVDLICGLPEQTIEGWLENIQALSRMGVDGFSIYELQVTSQNRRFSQNYGLLNIDRSERYLYFQAAEQELTRLGFHKSLFNHFARGKDTNLYFTFPERSEDCLAMGAIADGMLGDYHFRHPEYKSYLNSTTSDFPGLQGGLRRTEFETLIRPLETALLSGKLSQTLFNSILGINNTEVLFRHWEGVKMINQSPQKGRYILSANGSWFVGEMMDQVVKIGENIGR